MFLSLAPMDGITDAAFRKITKDIVKQYGKTQNKLILTTEFMSADGFVSNPSGVIKHLLTIGKPKNALNIAQIFGKDEKNLIKTALWIKENLPCYNLVELNIGCPSRKIYKIGAGSGMMKNKEKTLQIIKKLSKILDGNLSIKTRIGLTNSDIPKQSDFIIKASNYCKIITIHGRTLNQGLSGEVNRKVIYQIKEKIVNNCLIIGNGGIKSYKEIHNKLGNLDGIAIGQNAIGNPWIFTPFQPNRQEKKKTILKHLLLFFLQEQRRNYIKKELEYLSPNKQLKVIEEKQYLSIPYSQKISIKTKKDLSNYTFPFRKHLFLYLKGYPNAKKIKQQIIETPSFQKLKEIIAKL